MKLVAVILLTAIYICISEVRSDPQPDHKVRLLRIKHHKASNYFIDTEIKKNFDYRYNYGKRVIEKFNRDKIAKSYFDQVLKYLKATKENIYKFIDIADEKFKNYEEAAQKTFFEISAEIESFETNMEEKSKNKKDKSQVQKILRAFDRESTDRVLECYEKFVDEARNIFKDMKTILDKAYNRYAYITSFAGDCVGFHNPRGCSKDLVQDCKDLMLYVDNDLKDSFSSSNFDKLGSDTCFVQARADINKRMVDAEQKIDQIV